MAYQLEPHEAPAAGIRRIACECLDKIDEALQGADCQVDEAVHESRKQLKKLRSLIRLVRPVLGGGIYRIENRCYADAGRLLAPFRDAMARVELVEKLIEDPDDGDRANEALKICAVGLRIEHEKTIARDNSAQAREEVAGMLAKARRRIDDWPIDKTQEFGLFRQGLKQVYRRGRKSLSRAFGDPTVEHLHEWRKQCKYLRHQMNLLAPTWPPYFELAETTLHELTNHLGDDHDLAVLRETLPKKGAGDGLTTSQLRSLDEALDSRHRELIDLAFPLGRRIFAEKPKPFVCRMAAYWDCRPTT